MVLPEITLNIAEAYQVLAPLALILGGITLYGVFVFNFYRFLARKDVFTLDLQKHNQSKLEFVRKTVSVIFYVLKFLVLYPVCVFFWFAVMACLIYLLTQNQSASTVMLIAMGVVGSIRISAYYNEALATDLAKMLPFALLGIMLINNSLIQLPDSPTAIQEAALQLESIIYYLIAVVLIELLLRITYGLYKFSQRQQARRQQFPQQQVLQRAQRVEAQRQEQPSGPSVAAPQVASAGVQDES